MGTKRPRGEGSIYQRKDGRFEGAAFVPMSNGSTRRIRVYGTTRAEANVKLQVLLDRARKGIPAPTRSWTVGTYLDYWMDSVVRTKNRARTVELYEATIRLHIKPFLGSKPLSHLSVMDVQNAINALIQTGHSARTVHKMRTVLSSALGRALREELVFRNVARLVELPAYERKDIRPWNAEEATRFLEAVQGHDWEPGYQLLIFYGMRRGEVLGLRWGDIDFPNNRFHVRQQIQRIEGELQAGPVKTTAGRRTLPLLPALREVLVRHAAAHGITLNVNAEPDGTEYADKLVLTSSTGHPVEPGNFARTFHRLSSKAGLPRITVHSTRHTAATLLKSLGVPARDAQLILGHSNVTTTQQLYQHGDIDAQRDALESMERTLLGHDDAAATSGTTVPLGEEAGTLSRQRRLTTVPHTITVDIRQLLENKENRRSTRVTSAAFLGGPAGDRTLDILLKRTIPALLADLPTPVIRALHTSTQQHILGAVAVNYCRQTVPPIVSSGTQFADLIEARNLCRAAITETLRRRSFPLNLIPHHAPNPMEVRS